MPVFILLCDLTERELKTNAFEDFLSDARDNVAVLIGKGNLRNVDRNAFTPAQWQRYTTALEDLYRNNRILTCSDVDDTCPMADPCLCQAEMAAADFVLCGPKSTLLGSHIVRFGQYGRSQLRRAMRKYELSFRGETTPGKFVTRIIRPMCKAVNEIVILDRQLGRHWQNPGYRRTLTWLTRTVRQLGVRNITLITCADDPGKEADLHDYCVQNAIKFENREYRSLPHDRAIVSKRFTLQVDRGFDLITVQNRVRGTGIFVVQRNKAFRMQYQASTGRAPNFSCAHCHSAC